MNAPIYTSPLLTVEEAGVYLRLADQDATPEALRAAADAVLRLVRTGKLRPIKIGKRYALAVDELRRFIHDESKAIAS